MSAILTTILTLLTDLASATSSTSEIGKIITALINILPTVIQEAEDMIQPVKNIITALSSNEATTQDQLDQLAALDAQADAAFDAAASQYQANHPDDGSSTTGGAA